MQPLVFGDPHGNFEFIIESVLEHRPAAIILLGDIEATAPLDELLSDIVDITDIYWIPGNHDVDKEIYYKNLFESKLAGNCLHGRVVEIDDGMGGMIRVAGLGGEFNSDIWLPPSNEIFLTREEYASHVSEQQRWGNITREKADGLILKSKAAIFYNEYFDLSTQKADILITHDAPAAHPRGHGELDDLAMAMGVKRVFHGHHHDSLDYSSYAAPYKVHGVGLNGVTNIQGVKITPGLLDQKRAARKPAMAF